MKEYYNAIKAAGPFSHIEDDKDLKWLLTCIEGKIVDTDKDKDVWKEDGFIYIKLAETGKALRVKELRAGKICGFKCEFHQKFIDYLNQREDRLL